MLTTNSHNLKMDQGADDVKLNVCLTQCNKCNATAVANSF